MGVATSVLWVEAAVEGEAAMLEDTAVETGFCVATVVGPALVAVALVLSAGAADCTVAGAEGVAEVAALEELMELEEPEELPELPEPISVVIGPSST